MYLEGGVGDEETRQVLTDGVHNKNASVRDEGEGLRHALVRGDDVSPETVPDRAVQSPQTLGQPRGLHHARVVQHHHRAVLQRVRKPRGLKTIQYRKLHCEPWSSNYP